jgi:hypothetical protein
MDVEACNYDDSAWSNDDCEYGPSAGNIIGDEYVELQGAMTEWVYSCDEGADSYVWEVVGGTILSGQGTSSIIVEWTDATATGSVSVVASNSDDCAGDASSMVVDIVLGIEDIDYNQSLSIFPNPVSTELSISFDSEFISPNHLCKIYSSTGTIVTEFTISSSTTSIDVSEFAAGSYILSMLTPRGLVHESFVISKLK